MLGSQTQLPSITGAVRRDEPVVLSEFGGVTLRPHDGDEWFGYGVEESAEQLAQLWDELFAAVLESEALAGLCYTQFADTRQETNGMVTAWRAPKVDPARVRVAVRRTPPSVPSESVLHNVLGPPPRVEEEDPGPI